VKVLLEGPPLWKLVATSKRCELALFLDDSSCARRRGMNQLVSRSVSHTWKREMQLRAIEVGSEAGRLETSADVISSAKSQNLRPTLSIVWSDRARKRRMFVAPPSDDGDRSSRRFRSRFAAMTRERSDRSSFDEQTVDESDARTPPSITSSGRARA